MQKEYLKPIATSILLLAEMPICGSGNDSEIIGIGPSDSDDQPDAEANEYRTSIWED